ncbi:aldehyde dehydrogenase family protein [Roseixanthobacter liquoris]|uniref:aldehyde dehydrogenase family protein n=1 Tax=Roseixanthobacter liquoris TaxID=3119921 RepID=UPI00372A0860
MGQDQVFIDGRWIAPASGDVLPVLDPSTGATIGHIARGGEADIDLAVNAARNAFQTVWGAMAALERGRLLSKLGLLILDHLEELAEIEAADTGKPMKLARNDIRVTAGRPMAPPRRGLNCSPR